MTVATVNLWGSRVGAVQLGEDDPAATFEYDPAFADHGVEVAPLSMPLRRRPYRFAALNPESFHGLPGMLADALPDRFGNALIDSWLAGQGRSPDTFDAVERLCYTGSRATGALEFAPALGPAATPDHDLQVAALVELASDVLADREGLVASLKRGEREQAMLDILSVGTSAGGARAKAVIAFDATTDAVRSGQLPAAPGFEHWLLKFDGVVEAADRETLGEPQGFGAVELAYANMAVDAGIEMTECRLLEEGGRRHFMTRRFDRVGGDKLHMQSLAALAHLDFLQADAHSYEQAFLAVRELGLGAGAAEEQFRRMTFNVVARNQDDHVKNIAFLMDRDGAWRLSPAFDVTYAYNPAGAWTGRHQMSLAGRRDGFVFADLQTVARVAGLKAGAAGRIVGQVTEIVADWRRYAAAAGVDEARTAAIEATLRLDLARP